MATPVTDPQLLALLNGSGPEPTQMDAPSASGRPRITVTPQREQSPYANAISSVESGGRYEALGPQTRTGDRAHGKYQIMGANIGPWSKEVLGRELTPQEFVSSPEAQDAIFNAKFGAYAQKYGPEGAAKAWFAGEKGMHNPNAKDALGTTVDKYAQKFNAALGSSEASAQSRQPRPVTDPALLAQLNGGDDPVASQQAPVGEPEMQGPQPSPVGFGEALGRGVRQGAMLNFGDEVSGLQAASGIPETVRQGMSMIPGGGVVAPVVGAARMGFDYLTGGSTAQNEYNRTVEAERARNEQAQAQRPGATIAGNIAGGLALPVGGALGAATLPVRIGRGAAVGAGVGAAAGAGEGEEFLDRAGRATTGAALGGAVGAAAPVAMKGVEAIGRGIAAAARPIITAIRGARDPDAEAGRRIVAALRRDVQAGAAGLEPAEYAAARAAGAPVALVDAGGTTTRALARSSANTSPEARGALERMTSDRFENQGNRTVEFVRNLVRTPGDASVTRDALQGAGNLRSPFYQRAYRDGSGGVLNDDLSAMMQSPVMMTAAKEAQQSIQNKIAAGRAINPLTPDGRPTLEFWDQVKRNLDSAYNVARRQGDNELSADIQALRTNLLGHLDAAVPSYATARGVAAELFKASDALEAGEKFVTSGRVGDVRKIWSKMNPEERTLFSEGFVSSYIEKINKIGDRRSILNQIEHNADARARLEIALGPQRAKELQAFLRVEGLMDRMRGALGNSTTAQQLVDLGLAGGAGAGAGLYGGDLSSAASTAGLIYGLRQGGRAINSKIDQRVAQRVGEMLASNDPKVLQKGIKIVSHSPLWMKTLRAADDQIAKTGGLETPKGFIPLQSLSGPRAEDNDPNVERPRGQ